MLFNSLQFRVVVNFILYYTVHFSLQALANAPHASAAVAHATQKHLSAFERIAAEHAAIGAQQEAQRLALAAQAQHSDIDNGQYHP